MQLHAPFIQLPVLFDAPALAREVEALGEGAWRAHPQGFPGNSAIALISAHGDPASDAVAGPMRPTPWLQRSPGLVQVLAALGATWGRARLMRLSGQAEVTEHVDTHYYWRERMRVHVPIVTQATVRFHCGGEVLHMAAGECWIFDTWRAHKVLNDDPRARIHLVADTVGGAGLWPLIEAGAVPGARPAHWQARQVPIEGDLRPALDYESVNQPEVMSPWEVRAHIAFALAELGPHAAAATVAACLQGFARLWHALWSCHGESRAGWPRYRSLIEATRRELAGLGHERMVLPNRVPLAQLLDFHLFDVMLADRVAAPGAYREHGGLAYAGARPWHAGPAIQLSFAPRPVPARQAAPPLQRPVFLVCAPRSGSSLLFETLARAPGVHTIGGESHALIEGVAGLSPAERGYASNRLLQADATPERAVQLRARFHAELRDRHGARPGSGPVRMLEKTPKNALRIPFLAAVFPDAHFVYLYREPRQVLSSMIEAWQCGRFQTYPQLPGWSGPPWSLLLVPGWQALAGQPLARIVAYQWATATSLLLDDLQALPRAQWSVARYDALMAAPDTEVARICDAVGLDWDLRLGSAQALPLSRHTVTPPAPGKWQRHAALLDPLLPGLQPVMARAAGIAAP